MNNQDQLDYRSLLKNALVELKKMRSELNTIEEAKTEPIAIIGMGCRFPGGANNPQAYWQLLHNGINAVTEIPSDRWDVEAYYDSNPEAPGKMYTRYGAFLDDVSKFDPQFFEISPREATSMDPQQRLLLEVTWEALENASIAPEQLKGTQTGVFMGVCFDDYAKFNVKSTDSTRIEAYDALGNFRSVAAGRIAYFLGLQGPTMQLDTTCSSALLGVHLASQSLRSGESNVALAGGVNLMLEPGTTIGFCKLKALSADGKCKTFDSQANGYVRGEGCGVIVLKRLSDAIADGDHIHAIIRGSAANHDGRSNGLTAPNGSAQEALVRQALASAKLKPSQIQYVEAHGTGTSLGDPIEVSALGRVLGQGRSQENPLIIGSVKTNFGHLETAAGVAGLMKVVLSLQNKEIPPHLHFQEPNPYIPWQKYPLKVPTEATPWSVKDGKRLGGVSSFGMSGTNVHVILEEAPEPTVIKSEAARPFHLLSLSAKTESALTALVNNYQQFLATQPEVSLADVCFTANTGRSHFEYRLCAVSESTQQLWEQLKAFHEDKNASMVVSGYKASSGTPKVAFLFTGQGSQYIGMGYQLYQTQPTFRNTLDYCDQILRPYLDHSLLSVLYPESGTNTLLDQTAYTQPALFALEYALAQLWKSWGIEPDIVMGHSVGEYVAACFAGVFSLEDGLKLIAHRGRLMQGLPGDGKMVSLLATESVVKAAIQPYGTSVAIAAVNGENSVVISGESEAVTQVVAQLEGQGIKNKTLKVSHGFHSPLMEPILSDFKQVASSIQYSRPQIKLVSNVTGELANGEVATANYWCRHIRESVKFAAGMKTLHSHGYDLFLEIGAKPILLGMGVHCLPEVEATWLPSLRPGLDDWQQILESLAQLYVRGVPVDWSGFNKDYSHKKVELPTYAFERQHYWVKPPSQTNQQQHLLQNNAIAFHPLLGQQLRLPFSKEIRFETQFSPNSPSFMDDHKIFGITVAPAASHISMALSAVKEALGRQSFILEDLFFPQPLVLGEDNSKTVQFLINQEQSSVYSFQIISLRSGKNEKEATSWMLHGTGKIRLVDGLTDDTSKQVVDIKAVQARCEQSFSKEEFYKPIWDFGYTLGPLFQWNGQIWRREGEALCQIEVPKSGVLQEASEYELYPGLIDSCLQLLVNLGQVDAAEVSKSQQIYLPFIIEYFKFYGRPDVHSQLWCYAQIREENGDNQDLVGDIRLFTEDGILIAEITGFELRRASQQALQQELEENVDNLLYEITWKPQRREHWELSVGSQEPGNWLIFVDRGGTGEQIAQLFSERGASCVLVFAGSNYERLEASRYRVNPSNPEDFQKLFQEVKADFELGQSQLRGILHLWSLDSSIGKLTLNSLQNAQELGCASVLHTIQALLQDQLESPLPRLCLVTRGAMSVGDRTLSLQVEQAPLWGLGKVIALEHPDLDCLRLDLDPSADNDGMQALFEELCFPDLEDQIAFRQGIRYIPRLIKSRNFVAHSQPQVDENASYLITGGLGALGTKVANWLVEQGARNLVLTGRSGVSEATQEVVSNLENSGVKVLVAKADVSNAEEVAQVLEAVKFNMPPLRGIIHAAGVLDDGLILRQDWHRFNRVMTPKVAGSWNLHSFTQDLSLDFFVCFSSIASLVGSPGQGNYAAANAFMDALCYQRRALGLPASTINWGPWAGEGMAARAPEQWKQLLANWGFGSFSPEQGLQALGQVLRQQPIQLGVLPINWSKFIEQFQKGVSSRMFCEVAPQPDQKVEESHSQQFQFLNQLQQATPSKQQKLLIGVIEAELIAVLRFESSQQLNPQQGFFEMGIDSLMAIELKNKLETSLGCSLPSTLLFKYPTLESLADYLVSQLVKQDSANNSNTQSHQEQEVVELTNTIDNLEQLSDAEAEALLLSKLDNF